MKEAEAKKEWKFLENSQDVLLFCDTFQCSNIYMIDFKLIIWA